MSYIEDIQPNGNLTVDVIIEAAKNNLPASHVNIPWFYPGLDHGKAVLTSEEQLNCYMASYGEMHKCKLEEAFKNFPFIDINDDLEIIDWGCGQGIASVFLINKLKERNLIDKLKKVTLIEPSSAALKRAKLHVENSLNSEVELVEQNVFLPTFLEIENDISDLFVEENICIHLFSNILDIPNIDLKKLTSIISKTGYKHYFVCVGPYGPGKERIEGFFRYFNVSPNEVFSDCHRPSYGRIENGKWFGCVTKGFKLTREDGRPFLIPLSFYPPKEFAACYQLDELGKIDSSKFPDKLKYFDALAPFDIGASVYEDFDPILAVLNNIITRGIPTKCSPFIEDKFAEAFSHITREEENGTIVYKVKDNKLIEDNYEILQKSPVGIAWIQKLIIEAILTGKLSLNDEKWNIVIVEDKIPCAALALEDLRILFNNLCKLSWDYKERKFPDLNLQIVNSISQDSLLHLNNKVVASKKKIKKENIYDLVLEINFENSIDPESVQFSEFKVKNDCYFKIGPSKRKAHRYILTSDRIKYDKITELDQSGFHKVIEAQAHILRFFLQLLFRKIDFRPGQLPILNRALQNKGVIGLLPTGGGKSLTYQLAAMLQPGITVIIDPLKSLMMDQYDGLKNNSIDACMYINSDLSREGKEERTQQMENSEVLFVFLSPERICSLEFRERLRNMNELGVYFSYGVIDEVHCVSEWGHDFRPSYLHLGRNLYKYVRAKGGVISLFGLTATASFDVLSDVERELSSLYSNEIDHEIIVRYENTNRLELQYKIEKVEMGLVPYRFDDHGVLNGLPKPVKFDSKWNVYEKKQWKVKEILKKIPSYIKELESEDSIQRILDGFNLRENLEIKEGNFLKIEIPDDYLNDKEIYEHAGIIFCPHVNNTGVSVSTNYERLSKDIKVGYFYGKKETLLEIDDNQSVENMNKFRKNEFPLMVATKAFGMGIDKPNVRFTINMNYSSSLESFVQEAGRGGRDRKMALAIILMTNYDLVRLKPFLVKPDNTGVIFEIRGKWFRREDLRTIARHYHLKIDKDDIEVCNPLIDFIRLNCRFDNIKKDTEESEDSKKNNYWRCKECSRFSSCQLRHIDRKYRYNWLYYPDLKPYLDLNNIKLNKEDFIYINPDYETVIYFFDNNFKGEIEEKANLDKLLYDEAIEYSVRNINSVDFIKSGVNTGILKLIENLSKNEELIFNLPYTELTYADLSKVIYRMMLLGVIDDFTQDYYKKVFRLTTVKKSKGFYYNNLYLYLRRYYSNERAENEVEKASVHKGGSEIIRCLYFITEFVYSTIVHKRKQAIDDMRLFGLKGLDPDKDWKVLNEELKDEIYYYFNSKFARMGYHSPSGEPFSLYDDIIGNGNNDRDDFNLVFKYMRVMDPDVLGNSGAPKDNINHLRGAIRLIKRSRPENNALKLLNVFCLVVLNGFNNTSMTIEISENFKDAYLGYLAIMSKKEVLNLFNLYFDEFNSKDRNIIDANSINQLKKMVLDIELVENDKWFSDFTDKYLERWKI